eukprot:4214111-Amphidinium_carterae.1
MKQKALQDCMALWGVLVMKQRALHDCDSLEGDSTVRHVVCHSLENASALEAVSVLLVSPQGSRLALHDKPPWQFSTALH